MKNTIGISEYIDTDHKEYAIHTVTSRGIPSFFDGLTPVQRIILKNAPAKPTSTNSTIGDCIADGYRHGDVSLANAISKLCRSTSNSKPLLTGSGFFGNSISGPAAPRYTKCGISEWAKDMINQYSDINETDEDGFIKYYNLRIPIGLVTNISGISTGFSSTILPRKPEDIEDYLNGIDNPMIPHFEDFVGNIAYDGKNRWILSSKVSKVKGDIQILDLPFGIRYDTFLAKLNELISEYPRLKFDNNTKDRVNILIKSRNRDSKDINAIYNKVKSITTRICVENVLVTVGDGIIEYGSIFEYLDDYKIYYNSVKLKWMTHEIGVLNDTISYKEIYLGFIQFMLEGKRTLTEINNWIKQNAKGYNDKIKSIPAYKINKQEVSGTIKDIKRLKRDLDKKVKETDSFRLRNNFDLSFLKKSINV